MKFFVKDVAFHNIKSHKKVGFCALCRKQIVRKTLEDLLKVNVAAG